MLKNDLSGVDAPDVAVQAGTVFHLDAVAGFIPDDILFFRFREKDRVQVSGRDGELPWNAWIFLIRGEVQYFVPVIIAVDGAGNGVLLLRHDQIRPLAAVLGQGLGAQGNGGKLEL